MMKIVSGFEQPDEGQVLVDGKRLLRPSRRGIVGSTARCSRGWRCARTRPALRSPSRIRAAFPAPRCRRSRTPSWPNWACDPAGQGRPQSCSGPVGDSVMMQPCPRFRCHCSRSVRCCSRTGCCRCRFSRCATST
nr:hypothetical protein [Massilia agilis]